MPNSRETDLGRPSGLPPGLPPGLIVAATASGSGKTLITAGLIAAMRRRGLRVGVAKVGPDYIDPGFHGHAAGRPCVTLDAWAMTADTLNVSVANAENDADIVVCEGVMGLFDGAPGGAGSTADIARRTGWPVVLVHDPAGQAASAAAVAHGFSNADTDVDVVGILFNKVAGERHWALIDEAMSVLAPMVPCLGWIVRTDDIIVPSRHLGLVQAQEAGDLDRLFDHAVGLIEQAVNVDALIAAARPRKEASAGRASGWPPLGSRIAVASDVAFAFSYPHVLDGWRRAGASLHPFSPLGDEAPDAACDAVYLPGGYPELYAGQLASNETFLGGLRAAAGRGTAVFGECGGYMVLGETMIDGDGTAHAMAGLLPLTTSFAERKRHLGYRAMVTVGDGPLGAAGTAFRGHEFHYASVIAECGADPLFAARDARDADLEAAGLARGSVCGSFLHIIDRQ